MTSSIDDLTIPVEIVDDGLAAEEPIKPASADLLNVTAGLWSFAAEPASRQAAVSADDVGVITDQWTVVVDTVLIPALAADYTAGLLAQQTRLLAGLTAEQAALFAQPVIDVAEAAQLVAAEARPALAGIGDVVWANARTSLVEGMAAGESIPKLAARVRAAAGVSTARATVIARTESMAARNRGAYDEMSTAAALGVVTSKTWLATHDARTRLSHVQADGQTVPFGSKFTVGGWPAEHPHDVLLPAEERVNCRCTLLFGVSDEPSAGVLTASLLDFRQYVRDSEGQFAPVAGRSVADLPRGPVPSVGEAAKATNPHFGSTAAEGGPTYREAGKAGQQWTPEMGPPPSGAYEENCTNAVMAFEMRMRGYDVTASPIGELDRYGYADGRSVAQIDALLAGSFRAAGGTSHGRSFAGQRARTFKEVDAEVKGWPEGGRGFVHVGKHVFSVVKVRGKVQYVESQYDATPSRIVTREYRKKFADQKGSRSAKVVRLDDLVPTDGIFEAVT